MIGVIRLMSPTYDTLKFTFTASTGVQLPAVFIVLLDNHFFFLWAPIFQIFANFPLSGYMSFSYYFCRHLLYHCAWFIYPFISEILFLSMILFSLSFCQACGFYSWGQIFQYILACVFLFVIIFKTFYPSTMLSTETCKSKKHHMRRWFQMGM